MRCGRTPGVRGRACGSARRRRWPPRSPAARPSAKRSPSPMTRFQREMSASTRARQSYPEALCQPMRPRSAMHRRCAVALRRRGLRGCRSAPRSSAAARRRPPRDGAPRPRRRRRRGRSAPSPVKEATGPSTWSSRGPTCEPSSASLSVSADATIRPVSASVARCSFLQARRRLVPCFSTSHSPGPHSRRPVLSTSRCTGSRSPRRGRGTSSVSARRLRVEWSGTARSRPSRCRMEPIRPSVWRSARRNTARSVRAVAIARAE